jgi:anti-sigma regulatory factor (Ser/Thr protein kinase)
VFDPSSHAVVLDGLNPSGEARRLVREACVSWLAGRAEDVELLVTELVANALRYGVGHVAVRIDRRADRLRIGVWDASPDPPILGEPPPTVDDERGRGLHIVEALASAWGWDADATAGGKTVWFELHRDDR